MIRRIVHVVIYSLLGLAAASIVALAFFAWRLSLGPVSLAFLVPTVEQLFEGFQKQFQLSIGDIVLTWAGWDRGLDVRLINVQVLSSNEVPILRIPELAASLSVEALSRGVIAPATINLFHPNVHLVRLRDGRLQVTLAGQEPGSEGLVDRVLGLLQGTTDPDDPTSYLRRIGIIDAALVLEDQRLSAWWRATVPRAQIARAESGLQGEAVLALASHGEQAELAVAGQYRSDQDRLDASVTFSALRPAAFAHAARPLSILDAIDAPLKGHITLSLRGDGMIEDMGCDIAGDAGHLAFPVPLAQDLGVVSLAQRLEIRDLALKAHYQAADDKIEIDDIKIAFKDGETVYMPAPADHAFPLREVSGRGRYLEGQNRIEVEAFELDLAGPTILASGAFGHSGGAINGTAEMTAHYLRTNEFGRYWPPALAPGAYEWVVEHLSDGEISTARLRLSLASGDNGPEVTSLAGTMNIKGVTVNYLPAMPKIRDASGVASFDEKTLTIQVTSGQSDGLTIDEGIISFPDLAAHVPHIDIDLRIGGSVRGALELLGRPPLGYTKTVGIDPAHTSGNVSTRIKLKFPLLKDLALDRIDVSASANIDKLFITDAAFGVDIKNGALSLELDEDGMGATGRISLAGIPGAVTWRENFIKAAPFRRRLEFNTTNADIAQIGDLGLQALSRIKRWMNGLLDAKLTLVEFRDAGAVFEAHVDARDARITFPYLGWVKEAGTAADADLVARLQDGRLVSIPKFAISSADLVMIGSATETAGGVKSFTVERLAHGRTDIHGTSAMLPEGGWDALVAGAGLDLGPLSRALRSEPAGTAPRAVTFTLAADLDRVWFGPDEPMQDLMATVVRQSGTWTLVQAQGLVGDRRPVEILISPTEHQTRSLNIEAKDAGAALRTLGIFPDMIGGRLEIDGTFDDSQPGRPLSGRLKVEDYRIVNAPFLARLLNVMALTGILEALRGPGIAFSTLNVPFNLKSGVLRLTDARAYGTSLGVTASGDVNTITDTVDIEGTVVPFYLINAALGRIPLVGDLFTGGEKGGGLFAATYTMTGPLDDPKVSVNPISVFAPSFLRRLFDIFESPGRSEPAAPPQP